MTEFENFGDVGTRAVKLLAAHHAEYKAWEKTFVCKQQCKKSSIGPPWVEAPTGDVTCPLLKPECWGAKEILRLDELWLQGKLAEKGVLEEFRTVSFATSEKTKMLNAARRWWKEGLPKGCAWIVGGGTGAGKTHTAACLLREWVKARKGPSAYWYSAKLFNRLRFAAPEEKVGLLEEVCKVRLLIIDDLDTERDTDYVKSSLDEIISERAGNHLPTIITTNRAEKDFDAAFGARIADRLRGPWGMIFACKDLSRRRRLKEAKEG